MGTVRFHLPDELTPAASRCLELACLVSGYDQKTAIPTTRKIENQILTLTKEANESGYLSMPWPLTGLGTPHCMSATLRERNEPYYLLLELARGKLNQVRTQTAEWQMIGLVLDPHDKNELSLTASQFGKIVAEPESANASALAEDVLIRSMNLSQRVAHSFSEQLIHTRLSESGRLKTKLGCRVWNVPPPETLPDIADTFTAVRCVPAWDEIEPAEGRFSWNDFDSLVDWATTTGLEVSIGPLIDFDSATFPSWLKNWEGDLPSLAAFTCDFVETIIRRYHGRVQVWEVFAGFNHHDILGLSEDDRIRLAARLLDASRQIDPESEFVGGLVQPWGDYLSSDEYTYSPLLFSDTLLRAGFGLGSLSLDIRPTRTDLGPIPRDPIETYRLFDVFSLLSVPLEVQLSCGSSKTDSGSCDVSNAYPPGWMETAIALTFSLPQVHAVFWDIQKSHSDSANQLLSKMTSLDSSGFSLIQGLRRKFTA